MVTPCLGTCDKLKFRMTQILRYEWLGEVKRSYRDEWDNTVSYTDTPSRELVLRAETENGQPVYHVAYSAQLIAGRHARTVESKSFSGREEAMQWLQRLAQKHAPPDIQEAARRSAERGTL